MGLAAKKNRCQIADIEGRSGRRNQRFFNKTMRKESGDHVINMSRHGEKIRVTR